MRRFLPSVAMILAAIVVLATGVRSGAVVSAAIFAVVMVVGAVALSPLPFPGAAATTEWKRAEEAGEIVVLHRPGCPYCLRLRATVGRAADRATWVDIWSDADAAARVREATGGDETVPTVLVGGTAHVNPDPAWVRSLLLHRTST